MSIATNKKGEFPEELAFSRFVATLIAEYHF